jgi:myo-inositol-1(or 4)-monophosphatase
MKWQTELDLAVATARQAGEKLRQIARGAVTSDQGRDVKHLADVESEKAIIESLRAGSPHPLLTEESGAHGRISNDAPAWIVDPLDGTLNYSRDIPLCAVSIALWRGAEPLLGVVYDFNRDELFSGAAGLGAWLNDTPISPSGVAETERAVLATGFPVNRDFSADSVGEFVRRIIGFKKVRLFGSAALSLAYAASGRVDAYCEEGIMLWDVAAGIAIVAAAGGAARVEPSSRKEWARDVWVGEVFHCGKAVKEQV